jgi:hypothetical protein
MKSVRVIEGLDEPLRVPLILVRAQIAMQEPLCAISAEGQDACSPPHANVVDEPLFPVEVDDCEGTSRIPLDACWEAVGLAIPYDPDRFFFPKEPDRGDSGTGLRRRGQISKQRARQELIQIDAS